MPPAIAVSTIDSSNSSVYDYLFQPWIVCFTASLFFFFEFVQLNMFNALDPALMSAFGISATQLGRLSANYFYANVIFLFPAGMILDRVSTRWIIIIATGASVMATLGFAFSNTLWQAELFRFITGIGGSFCFLSNVRLASRWFAPRQMALIIGLIVTFAMIGGMIAQTPLTLLTDSVGWRLTLLIDAGVGTIMLLLIVCLVKDYPPGQADAYREQQLMLHGVGFWKALWHTVKNLQNWLGGLYTSLMNLPIFLLGAMWGSLYLVQVRGLTRPEASMVTSMLFVGMIIGSPFVGWLSDRLKRRQLPMIVGAVAALVLIILLIYAPQLSLGALLSIFFALGFVTSTQIISYPLIAESNSLALTGTAEGLASLLIMAGGFTQPLFAQVMQWHWIPHYVHQVPVFSLANYQLALAIMPFAFIVGLIAAMLIRETYCTRENQKEGTS